MQKEATCRSMWLLKTQDDPLAAIRRFLAELWPLADLEGMLVPVSGADALSVVNTLLPSPDLLADANPFLPLMRSNAGKLVGEIARTHTHARMAAVLRGCEVRALQELVEREHLVLENWLIVGIDCLGCFPVQDFEWRVQKAGSVEQLTRDVLRNARQGGIAIDRFRSACQACARLEPSCVDLCIDLFGLPVQDAILVCARDEPWASRLELGRITAGLAPSGLILEHEIMLRKTEERRFRERQRQLNLPLAGLPANLDELVSFLLACQPCTNCLEACPVLAQDLTMGLERGTISRDLIKSWLLSCAECGMCEQACPRGLPLAAVMNRVNRDLQQEPLAV